MTSVPELPEGDLGVFASDGAGEGVGAEPHSRSGARASTDPPTKGPSSSSRSCAFCHHDTENKSGICAPCQQWADDHPNGITREEREAMDNYEGTGL